MKKIGPNMGKCGMISLIIVGFCIAVSYDWERGVECHQVAEGMLYRGGYPIQQYNQFVGIFCDGLLYNMEFSRPHPTYDRFRYKAVGPWIGVPPPFRFPKEVRVSLSKREFVRRFGRENHVPGLGGFWCYRHKDDYEMECYR